MKNRKISLLSCLLIIAMMLSAFAACSPAGHEDSSSSSKGTEQITENTSESGNNTETEIVEEETEEDTTPKLEGEYALLIENADRLKNTVTSYFTNAAREYYRVENKNMNFNYVLTSAEDQLLTLTNKKGKTYVDSSMDVYIKMNTGKTYYASGSQSSATANLYRYGYY